MEVSVWWLPPLFLAASASTVFLSCAIASGAGHISGDNTPHVSHCAMYQPERTVFGLGMTISAIVAAAMVYVIHLRTMLRNPSTSTEGLAHRYGTLFAGLAGPAAIALMGWITVNDFPWLHLILAISALLFFIAYASSNSVLRIQLAMAASTGDLSERVWALASDAFQVLTIISTFVFLWLWVLLDNHCMERHCPEGNSVGSSVAEYCIMASIFLYFLPYSWELLDTSVRISEGPTLELIEK